MPYHHSGEAHPQDGGCLTSHAALAQFRALVATLQSATYVDAKTALEHVLAVVVGMVVHGVGDFPCVAATIHQQ